MAHVGHNYPVHFRRDFNFNTLNNSAGFAAGYNCTFSGASGTIGSFLASHPLIAIAHDEKTFDGMNWKVAPTVANGHTVTMDIRTVTPPPTLDILIHAELFDDAVGSLGVAQFAAKELAQYSTFNLRWDPFSFTHPSLFSMGSTQFTVCGAIRWLQWNNL